MATFLSMEVFIILGQYLLIFF